MMMKFMKMIKIKNEIIVLLMKKLRKLLIVKKNIQKLKKEN